MRKKIKKTMCVLLSTAMVFTSGNFSNVNFHNPFDFSFSVEAAKNITETDDTTVSNAIVKDAVLLKALRKIVGGNENSNITVGQLKNYTGAIDLSSYTGIASLVGLGYARSASSFNLSKLTNVKTIAKEEFYGCSMTKVDLPSSITEIEAYAFYGCTKLATINLPDSITKIDENAFEACSLLANAGTTGGLKLPSKLIKLGSYAFLGCASIKSVVIPNTLSTTLSADDTTTNTMGVNVFGGCTSLSSVTFGTSMTKVPNSTFANCTSLKSVSIPKNFVEIGSNAFAASGLTSIDLSGCSNMLSVGEGAFSECEELKTASLSSSITVIKGGAFAGCLSLVTVSIPANSNLQIIGNNAFNGLFSMKKITFLANLKNLTRIEDFAFAAGSFTDGNDDVYGDDIYIGGPEEITIPGCVMYVGKGAFAGNRNLKKFTFNDMASIPSGSTTKKIDDSAFLFDWNLTDVKLPDQNVSNLNYSIEIGNAAFKDCWRLKNINFPSCLTKIGKEGFMNCGFGKKNKSTGNFDRAGLINVDLTKNTRLVDIEESAFQGCSRLDSFKFPSNLKIIPKKVLFQACVAENANYPYFKYHGLKEITLGNEVTQIGESAFAEDRCLVTTYDTLPESLVKIDKKAFEKCAALNKIKFKKNLTEIGESAFDKAAFLYKDNLNYGDRIFPGSGLESVSFEEAVNLRTIGKFAFRDTPIDSVKFDTDAPLEAVRESTFYGCTELVTVQLPDYVENVMKNALGACESLNDFRIYQTTILDERFVESTAVTHPTTKQFNTFMIRIPKGNVTVRVNESDEMEIYPLIVGSGETSYDTRFSKVDIDGSIYTYDPNSGDLVPSGVDSNIVTPHNVAVEKTTVATKTKYNVNTLQFTGKKEVNDVPVQVDLAMQFPTYTPSKDGEIAVKINVTSSLQYKMNVAKVPCENIECDDVYINVNNQEEKKAYEVKAIFTPEKTTDVITWSFVDGSSDIVEMKVSDDKKSAKFWAKGNGYGSAQVKITAGSVTKYIYVYVVCPANSLDVKPKSINVPYNSTSNLVATIKYDRTYDAYYKVHPENVKFISEDEDIIKVGNITPNVGSTTTSGNTYTAELIAGRIGKTKIKVIAEAAYAGVNKAFCKEIDASVVNSDLKIVLTDLTEDSSVINGDSTTLYKTNPTSHSEVADKVSKDYEYRFTTDDAASDEVEFFIDDENICKIDNYSDANKTFKIKGIHAGETTVTVWPKGFDSVANGITFTVKVTADVKGISMKQKTIKSGEKVCVIDKISNMLYDTIRGSDAPFSTITNNSIVFSSSNPNIATVDSKGIVKIKDVGPVDISCYAFAPDGTEIANAVGTFTCKLSAASLSITKLPDVEYTGEEIRPKVVVKANGRTLKEGVDYSISYRDCRAVGTASVVVKGKGNYIDEAATTFKILPRTVNGLTQAGAGKKAAVAWLVLPEAKGYEVATYKKGKYTKLGTTKAIRFSLKKLNKNKSYTIAVRAFGTDRDGKKYFGKYKTITLTPGIAKAKIKKLKVGKKKITVIWKKIKGVKGYEIYMSTKKGKGFKKVGTVKGAKKIKFIKKKLKKGKKYYFKVRAFKKAGKNKLFGAFSNAKSKKSK